MTTKKPSCKQVKIPMSTDNAKNLSKILVFMLLILTELLKISS